jgi:A/G-specific adenine glycosylase
MYMLDDSLRRFYATVRDYYHDHGRHDLPWRQPSADGKYDAYRITVSEIMLQQTQVSRVIPKYEAFMKRFPAVDDLAAAPLGDVLRAWSGLGYNRRAKFLWQTAQVVKQDGGGIFPDTVEELVRLPGIGPNTAGAILVYTYDRPAVFVETNIRTVFIHHFFDDTVAAIPDTAIKELIARTLDTENPREWYWALMDYGSHLKQSVGNLNRRSRTYARQSPFKGSKRQLRGEVLRVLGNGPHTSAALRRSITDKRLPEVLAALTEERLVRRDGQRYSL